MADQVLVVYVEAGAGETESRLLRRLRRRCPDVVPGLGLTDPLQPFGDYRERARTLCSGSAPIVLATRRPTELSRNVGAFTSRQAERTSTGL